jgi:hypothetical protein
MAAKIPNCRQREATITTHHTTLYTVFGQATYEGISLEIDSTTASDSNSIRVISFSFFFLSRVEDTSNRIELRCKIQLQQ